MLPEYEEIYRESVKKCFGVLVDNLIIANTAEEEKEAIERFKRCLTVHRKACRIYALLLEAEKTNTVT